MLIFTPGVTSRGEYIFKYIFDQRLGTGWRSTNVLDEFVNFQGPKINYSDQIIPQSLHIRPQGLLTGKEINPIAIEVTEMEGMKIFLRQQESEIGFDLFASIFYLLSRYEEYLPHTPDVFGRFKETDSIAWKNNFLKEPIIDHWIKYFSKLLIKRFPEIKFRKEIFSAIMTYDIDVAYKYRGRSFLRNAGGIVRDVMGGRFKNVQERLLVLLFLKKDPWDVYEFVKTTLTKTNLKSIFFFLAGDRTTYDHNLNLFTSTMKRTIKFVSSFSETGMHPSYFATEKKELIAIEKDRLEKVLQKPVTKSRQHYLRFSLPQTFETIAQQGITEDYSMCYAEHPGFRAGTCHPFYFYDLKNEKALNLKMFPSTCMEVTYKDFLKMDPQESLNDMLTLIEEVKQVDGNFIMIWHNETLEKSHDDKNWRWVHSEILQRLSSMI